MVKHIVGEIRKSSRLSLPLNQDSLELWAKILEGEIHNITTGEICSSNLRDRSLNNLREQDISILIQHGLSAMEEVLVLARVGEPLWIPDIHCNTLKLNEYEYFKTFQKGFAQQKVGFISEASRESTIVMMSPLNVIEIFMDMVCFHHIS